MRTKTTLADWLFSKDNQNWQNVTLPHTWNNLDGQDGGDNYYRGKCSYKCTLPAIKDDKCAYVEFEGANHIAQVYINGVEACKHEGGFSAFRVNVTDALLKGQAELVVTVDNSESHVYPQMADFTFFGGLYRPAHFVQVEKSHFTLDKSGTCGVFVSPKADGDNAQIAINAFCTNAERCSIVAEILDKNGAVVASQKASVINNDVELSLLINNAVRWAGRENPYLYKAVVRLEKDGATVDEVQVAFGVREYYVDAEKGFFLNGKSYPLRGVARHQDRFNKGWALSCQDHKQDLELICEMGANTIRLAHYQHSQTFYDLCDEAGMVLWAEIPFISSFMPDAKAIENTHSQMIELVAQNYNHASICFWGISNEITISGDESEELLNNLRSLNTLCKRMDPSRLTTMAQVAMLNAASEHNQITDVLSYNHYFGWYFGDVSQNGPWLDDFHKKYPNRPLGVSEYGAEANLALHSSTPAVRDYSEEYQAYYHEEMLKTFATRQYIWATHVWNMFDFAADARDEGGCKGRNNKGLVTFDRTEKKDSFYIYKAYWAKEKFVHICSKRFKDRGNEQHNIKIYSNCDSVTVNINGETKVLTGSKVFEWANAPLHLGENKVTATGDRGCEDIAIFTGVEKANASYSLPEDEDAKKLSGIVGVENWFKTVSSSNDELIFIDGFYSLRDTVGDLIENPQTAQILMNAVTSMLGKEASGGGMMKMMVKMMRNKSLESLLLMGADKVPKNAKNILNEQLVKIKK